MKSGSPTGLSIGRTLSIECAKTHKQFSVVYAAFEQGALTRWHSQGLWGGEPDQAHHPHCTKRGSAYLPRIRSVTQVGYGSGLLIRRTSTRFRWFESSTLRHMEDIYGWRVDLI